MPYDREVAQRLRDAVLRTRPEGRERVEEREMFGGMTLLLDGSMIGGVIGRDLVIRTGAAASGEALRRPHARPMDFTGRPLRGFVYVAPPGFRGEAALDEWVALGLAGAREANVKKARRAARASAGLTGIRPR